MFENRFSRHLTEAQILEENGISWLVKLLMSLTICITLVLIWLASSITVNEAVKANGEFLPIQGVQRIHPPEGGIVTEILVKNGQNVTQGQLLIRLSNAIAQSDKKQTEARLMGLKVRAIRQEAFLNEKEADFSAIPQQFAHLIKEQHALLTAQNAAKQKGINVFEMQIKQKQIEIELANLNLRTMEGTTNINADLLKLQEKLGKKQLVSRLSQLEAKRVYLETLGKSKTLKSQITQSQSSLQEVEKKKKLFIEELTNQANVELGTINSDISQVENLLERLTNRTENLDIYAPIYGKVQNSQVQTVGAIFSPRDTLLEIVPNDANLQLALEINPKDVGYVKPEQTVAIQVISYDFNRFGGISGQLISVSPFTQLSPDKNVYYKGIVKLDKLFVGDPKLGYAVLPGMKAKADIISGNRSILSYILNPLTRPERKTSTIDAFQETWYALKSFFHPIIMP